ncbi:MAG: hypothetical protein Q9159_003691 [Coniocarpon cinnabarinum]
MHAFTPKNLPTILTLFLLPIALINAQDDDSNGDSNGSQTGGASTGAATGATKTCTTTFSNPFSAPTAGGTCVRAKSYVTTTTFVTCDGCAWITAVPSTLSCDTSSTASTTSTVTETACAPTGSGCTATQITIAQAPLPTASDGACYLPSSPETSYTTVSCKSGCNSVEAVDTVTGSQNCGALIAQPTDASETYTRVVPTCGSDSQKRLFAA